MYPGRDKASDGTIGDAAHQAQASDHNPDSQGVVRALDITHDPAHGCDIGLISDWLAESRDHRLSYVIANRLIASPDSDWGWVTYTGDDPHTNHIHISVVADSSADDQTPWRLGGGTVSLTGEELKDIVQNVASAIRKGSWRDGYNDGTFETPYRNGPTLTSLSTQIDYLQDLVNRLPEVETIDYAKLAKALLAELGA